MTDRVHFVILSVDAFADGYADVPAYLRPPRHGEWAQTEGDEQYDYGYLADEFDDDRYLSGVHRKWVGYLTEAELDAWLADEGWADRDDARAHAEPTMGSLTFEGMFPAYALNDEPGAWNMGGVDPVIMRQAYVTEYAYGTPPADQMDALRSVYGFSS